MTRIYKLFKISSNKEKFVKEFPTMREAILNELYTEYVKFDEKK